MELGGKRLLHTQEVPGSSPVAPTIEINNYSYLVLPFGITVTYSWRLRLRRTMRLRLGVA